MDNAIVAIGELELVSGVALTKEQIDGLTQDIVWMEEKIVDGQTVLAPQVYIANVDKYKIQDGQIIAGGDINLKVKDFENSGNFEAGNDMNIDATTIVNNGGTIQRDNALNEYAQIYANIYDVTIESAKSAILKDNIGSTYTNQENTSSKISIDDTKNSGALDTANTMGHEVAHVRQNQGQTRLRETKELQEEYADTFGEYSADGMEFSSSTYNNVNLNTDKATNPIRVINNRDFKVLSDNTNAYLQDKAKADSGDGRMDDFSIPLILYIDRLVSGLDKGKQLSEDVKKAT